MRVLPDFVESSQYVNAMQSLHCLVGCYQLTLQHCNSIRFVHSEWNMSKYVTMSSSHWSATSSNHLLTVCHWVLAVIDDINYSIPTKSHWNTSFNWFTHHKNTLFSMFKYCFIVSYVIIIVNFCNQYTWVTIFNCLNNCSLLVISIKE